jgi:hypothetical protein
MLSVELMHYITDQSLSHSPAFTLYCNLWNPSELLFVIKFPHLDMTAMPCRHLFMLLCRPRCPSPLRSLPSPYKAPSCSGFPQRPCSTLL